MTDIVIKTVEELKDAPEEYREAVSKLVISHAINELYGAQVFDEPAIAYAPTPYAKWLTCRVAMEEYGHHVRFKQLGQQMGISEERMVPGTGKKPLSIFEFPLKTWEEFVAIKLLADLAEILQVEDLLHCTFHPLRNLARMTMPEERFHAQFGAGFGKRRGQIEIAGESHTGRLKQFRPPFGPFNNRGRRGQRPIRTRFAKHHVIGARLCNFHRIMTRF